MAELAYAGVLKIPGETHAGSNPADRIMLILLNNFLIIQILIVINMTILVRVNIYVALGF